MNIKPQKQKKKPRPPKKISPSYLYNSGLYYLQRFTASNQQFRTAMMRKIKRSCHYHTDQDLDTCAQMLEDTIKKFEEAGLLNDAAYTQGMVTSLRRQGKSKRAITTKLKIKGIPSDSITKTLIQYDESTNETPADAEFQAALIFARKKRFGPFATPTSKPPEKALPTMARAGFSYDTCRKIIEMNPEDLDEYSNLDYR